MKIFKTKFKIKNIRESLNPGLVLRNLPPHGVTLHESWVGAG